MTKSNQQKIDKLAFCAARVLSKYGIESPDWDEWRDLKNALLDVHPILSKFEAEYTGQHCSTFNQELAKIIKK